jgi:ribosomal protein L11 methyltransferase
MYCLRVTCASADCVDEIVAVLWEAGTVGILQIHENGRTALIASFDVDRPLDDLTERLRPYSPQWLVELSSGEYWIQRTRNEWSPRAVGQRIFVAPPWSLEETPPGRVRVVHNPGLACGTGEHPCTQLALTALEKSVHAGSRMADVGTGSGILAIAALRLGASLALGVDTDESALQYARDNFTLNVLEPHLVAGSADALKNGSFDLVIANISGAVLLSISEELCRILRENGTLVLTGFSEQELQTLQKYFPDSAVSAIDEWRCLTVRVS